MNTELRDEAVEYGELARRALESAGGDGLVQAAEAEPGARAGLVDGVLAELGAWDLDPRRGEGELEAAAALCRSAGFWAVAYPVAERLARPRDVEADALFVVAAEAPAAPLAGLAGRFLAVTIDGRRSVATPRPAVEAPRRSAFVTALDLEPLDDRGAGDVALGLVLPCWALLGMLDRAIGLTAAYVREREQFGQALASFQSVQFQLTDAELERSGTEELAKYALWSARVRPHDAIDDALALRLAAVEAAETVFRVAHQLHGAIGFCDETALSWLSRASQPLRRLPFGLSATRAQLTRRVGRRGPSGLFDPAGPGTEAADAWRDLQPESPVGPS
jgi:hypothetical protein